MEAARHRAGGSLDRSWPQPGEGGMPEHPWSQRWGCPPKGGLQITLLFPIPPYLATESIPSEDNKCKPSFWYQKARYAFMSRGTVSCLALPVPSIFQPHGEARQPRGLGSHPRLDYETHEHLPGP